MNWEDQHAVRPLNSHFNFERMCFNVRTFKFTTEYSLSAAFFVTKDTHKYLIEAHWK